MSGLFKRKKKKTSITDVDIDRSEGVMYLVREYAKKIEGEDRTVSMYISRRSAEKALHIIKSNRKLSRNNHYVIEEFHYIEHKNSLVGK